MNKKEKELLKQAEARLKSLEEQTKRVYADYEKAVKARRKLELELNLVYEERNLLLQGQLALNIA